MTAGSNYFSSFSHRHLDELAHKQLDAGANVLIRLASTPRLEHKQLDAGANVLIRLASTPRLEHKQLNAGANILIRLDTDTWVRHITSQLLVPTFQWGGGGGGGMK